MTTICAVCGLACPATGVCDHHHYDDDPWASVNRVMCDLLHRSIAPRRLEPEDREPIDTLSG